MYWCRPGYRPIGGAMLKNLIVLILFTLSFSAFACWKVEGKFSVDGESWKIDQKIDLKKDYTMPMGTFLVSLNLVQNKDKSFTMKYQVHEKKGVTRTLVTSGEEENIKEKELRDIYSRGEKGQPHSIFTIKLINI